MPDAATTAKKNTQRIAVLGKIVSDRLANRRYQAEWRQRHWQLHGQLKEIVESLSKSPDLLDKLGNSQLARVIRKAVKDVQEEL